MSQKKRERLQTILTEVATKNNRVTALFDEADKRQDGANTGDEIAEIKKLHKEIEQLETEGAEIKEYLGIRDQAVARDKKYKDPVSGVPFDMGTPRVSEGIADAFKSIGDHVLGNEEMKTWMKQWEGRAPSQMTVQSPRVEVKSFLRHRHLDAEALKTLITGASSTSAGPLVIPDYKPLIDEYYQRPLTIRDIITVGQTNSDTVEFVRVTSATNAAAPVAEATDVTGASGTKPQSIMALARVTEAVKTIAHWIPATNRALSDAAQIRTLIDNFLQYGIQEELEDQILTGDASGENFDGVLHVSGTTAQAYDTNIITTTRKGRTKVRTTGRAVPTAWVMNPADWEAFDLLKDNEARYYYGGPMQLGQPRLWGLPVVESEGMTAGYAVCADWRLAVLWDKMQTAISMSNSHSDFFVRNLVAILAEMRAAFGILRPAAFVICDLTP